MPIKFNYNNPKQANARLQLICKRALLVFLFTV